MTPRVIPEKIDEKSDVTMVARGRLGILSLFDVVFFISANRLTGVLRVTNDDRTGYLEFSKGRLLTVNEWAGEHSEEAAIEFFQWQMGSFEFRAVPVDTDKMIRVTTENYLMGMAKKVDELRKGAGPDSDTSERVRSEYMSLVQKTRSEKAVTYPSDSDCTEAEKRNPIPDFDRLLQEFVKKGGAILHLKPDTAPRFIKDGESFFLNYSVLPASVLEKFGETLAADKWNETSGRDFHTEIPYSVTGIGHFIARVARDFGVASIAVRLVKSEIPDFADLHLPVDHFTEICSHGKDLVLISGPTCSGVSTTVASMIEFLNSTQAGMIVTFEQSCDYRHQNILSVINQVKVDFCNPDFLTTIEYGLQLKPDIVFVERLFNPQTARVVLDQVRDDRLVITTITAASCVEAIENAVALFRDSERRRILDILTGSLSAVICQRLAAGKDGRPVPQVEILMPDDRTRACIASADFDEVRKTIAMPGSSRHLSFEQSCSLLKGKGLL